VNEFQPRSFEEEGASSAHGEELDPRQWYSSNFVGIPARTLASVEFNENPVDLALGSVQETHGGLFRVLDQTKSLSDAQLAFTRYMKLTFALEKPQDMISGSEARVYRSSYMKLLSGWGFDSNGPAGAVLKGWVESRFGVGPTYHVGPLGVFPSAVWMRYLEEKLGSRYHNNCIYMQLDLLFEFSQYSLKRFGPGAAYPRGGGAECYAYGRHLLLYRGTDGAEAPLGLPGRPKGPAVLRLNNLVSFSVSRERAEEFGGAVLAVRVPTTKVLFFPGLLPSRVLSGEDEVIAVGGDFSVELCAL
jgi:NAD+---dinitrogen-reductase ADP-D-ribosyltransferase